MKQTMTIKEIAELCSVDERTVGRWIEKASGKTPTAADKMPTVSGAELAAIMDGAGHGKAAQFTLNLVLEIVRAGGNETLAELLVENAERTNRETMNLFLDVVGGDSREPLNIEHCIILLRDLHKNMGQREANACFKKAIGYDPPRHFPNVRPQKPAGLLSDSTGGRL